MVFRSPDEARRFGAPIFRLFRAGLNRTPEAAALQSFTSVQRAGWSFLDMARSIAGSEEFIALHGPGTRVDAELIARLFRFALQREPNETCLATWLSYAAGGAGRGEILAMIADSDEAKNEINPVAALFPNGFPPDDDLMVFRSPDEARRFGAPIFRLFRAGLNRTPEAAALQSFTSVQRAGWSFLDMARSIAGSEEFIALHGPGTRVDAELIARLFRFALQREPKETCLATWLSYAAGGAGRGEILAMIADSDEAKNEINPVAALFPNGFPPDDDLAYQFWLENHGEIDAHDRALINRHIPKIARHPLLSLLMQGPTMRPDLVEETINSLEAQFYPCWELCVTLSDATPAAVRSLLDRAARRVPGIVLVAVDAMDPPGQQARAALAASGGEMVGFIDPGDRLAASALYEIAAELDRHPGRLLVYTDEDRIDGDGRRWGPSFKSGWGADMLLAGDTIGQLAMVKRARVDEVGGIRPDGGLFARYDMLLRVSNRLHQGAVGHVPVPLFHRGRLPGRPLPFPHVRTTSVHPTIRRVIEHHLREADHSVTIEDSYIAGGVWPHPVVDPPLPPQLVSIIVPTHDQPGLLRTCMTGLLERTDHPAFEVILIDHENHDSNSLQLLRQLARDPRVRVHAAQGPFNWPRINNEAVAVARGSILVLLNDDVDVIAPSWLGEMVGQLSRPAVGIVGARLLYPDGSLQHGGIALNHRRATHFLRGARDEAGYLGQIALTRDLSAVTGACLAIKRQVYEEVGGLDERMEVTCSDVDLCLRARRAGYRVVWAPHALLSHVECASRGADDTIQKQVVFQRELNLLQSVWPQDMLSDPYLNPNLEVDDGRLLLASSPRRLQPWRIFVDGDKPACRQA